MGKSNRYLTVLILLPIRCYQWLISPILGPRCRFHPSCSHYAIDAITHLGLFKGGFITIKRLLRCHPFSQGGFDPIPTDKNKRTLDGL